MTLIHLFIGTPSTVEPYAFQTIRWSTICTGSLELPFMRPTMNSIPVGIVRHERHPWNQERYEHRSYVHPIPNNTLPTVDHRERIYPRVSREHRCSLGSCMMSLYRFHESHGCIQQQNSIHTLSCIIIYMGEVM